MNNFPLVISCWYAINATQFLVPAERSFNLERVYVIDSKPRTDGLLSGACCMVA